MIDAGDEFVCRSCGMVAAKEVVEARGGRTPQAIDYTKYALGGFLGPLEYGYEEKFSRGLSDASSSFRYLKLISDFSGRGNSCVYACAQMIQRVCEKLGLPSIVVCHSMVIARKVLELKKTRNEITAAAISAYSVISACKIESVTSVGVKEVISAHIALGHRLKASSLIQISLDSPVRLPARRPEDYLARVLVRLSSNPRVKSKIREEGINERIYSGRLYDTAKLVLRMVGEEMRGGHSPCALAATATYAAEVALADLDSRPKLLSQRDVALCVDVEEYTIREQYGEVFRGSHRQVCEALRKRSSLIQRLSK